MNLQVNSLFHFYSGSSWMQRSSLYNFFLHLKPSLLELYYLIVSLFVVSVGLIGYSTAKLPLMPYDALTYAISEKFNLKFSKAKISSDLINICVAGAICLIFIQSLGSIGIGTLIAAYFIGKILGWMIPHYQQTLLHWVFKTEEAA